MIPLAQLETWSGQGAIATSRDTYARIRAALNDPDAEYTDRNSKIFLQGSYGNDTNIWAESDVDVVMRYDGAFFHDMSERPLCEQKEFNATFGKGTYFPSDFKEHVRKALVASFGESVKPGTKAIQVEASGNRRKADVIVAFEYRRYYKFNSVFDEKHVAGICFWLPDGTLVANYPGLHSTNLTVKHQATVYKFKPMIRIFKNLRSKLIEDGLIAAGTAPSYYIEGLLYNVPDDQYVGDYQDITLNILKWLYANTDRTNFLCANEQYYLLRDNAHTCWKCSDGENFVNAAIKKWNDWE